MFIPTQKIALTGRTRSGKDHTALALGLKTFSIADPLYEICHYYLGSCDKYNPLHRRLLQLAGAWGRGITEPTIEGLPTQEELLADLKAQGQKIVPQISEEIRVPWNDIGTHDAFWLNIILARTENEQSSRIGIPNIRFENELEAFQRKGFLHLHITCSEETLIARRRGDNWKSNDNDPTEHLAKKLDHLLHGPTVIWNDPTVPAPTNRGFTTFENLIRTDRELNRATALLSPEAQTQFAIQE